MTAEAINEVTEGIIGAAITVHRELGPGLLESAYQACLGYELIDRGLDVKRQVPVPLVYRGVRLDCVIGWIHAAQMLSYLKLSGHKVGLLINFNVRHLVSGVKRLVEGRLY